MKMIVRIAAAFSVALSLAACGTSPPRNADVDSMAVGSIRTGNPHQVATDAAFVRLPPGAGAVMQVRERPYADGITQEIVLGSGEGGENRMDISIRVENARNIVGAEVPMAKPTHEGIRLELSERFPNVPMQVVSRPMRNVYGPFGLAIGRAPNESRCIYAWQWIDDAGDIRSSRISVFKKLGVVTGGNGAPASLRLRVCRQGVTVDQLATVMSQIVISRTAKAIANEPLARAEGVATRSLESEIAPPGPAVRVVSAPPPKPRVRARKRAPDDEAAAPQRPQRGAPQPTYPAPDQGGNRYLAPVGPAGPQAPNAAPSPAPGVPAPSAPRIPAPQAQPMGPQVRVIPMRQQPLDPSLPAAAYRGPGG
jgi:hypothetical protein